MTAFIFNLAAFMTAFIFKHCLNTVLKALDKPLLRLIPIKDEFFLCFGNIHKNDLDPCVGNMHKNHQDPKNFAYIQFIL